MPSLCGSFLTNKRSLIAFTWTITTVLTLAAFILALVMTVHTHTHYARMERYYEDQYEYQQKYGNYGNNNNNNNGDGDEDDEDERQGESADREAYEAYEARMQLSQMSSGSMTFVAMYTMAMAIALQLYGSTAIVGFTSLRGVYIAPCFSYPTSSRLKVGIFGGAIIVFANLLLVCAVIFGEVRVEDWTENNEHQDNNQDNNNNNQEREEPYEVERIATVLAVTCMFLAALYTIFAILLFLYYGNEDPKGLGGMDDGDGVLGNGTGVGTAGVVGVGAVGHHVRHVHHLSNDSHRRVQSSGPSVLPSIATDPRRENFITMGES